MSMPPMILWTAAGALAALLVALIRHRRARRWNPVIVERDEHLDLWGIG